MERALEIASKVSTPLALAGFFAACFFLVARQLIARDIFPRLTQQFGGNLLRHIVDRLFILSFVAMLLGFAGYVLTVVLQSYAPSVPDGGKLSLGQFVIGKENGGRFVEVLVNNTSHKDLVLTKFVYSRGVSSAEMQAITRCCVYCMETWYAVQHGEILSTSTPGTRIEQTVTFIRGDTERRSFRGRLHYAPGCMGPLFAQLEMNISVVAPGDRVTKVGVFWPEEHDKSADHGSPSELGAGYKADMLLAPPDTVCVRISVQGSELQQSLCRPVSTFEERFL